jgi:hypothetical protein
MKRAIIKKDGIITNQSEGTEESVLAWIEKHKAMGSFGSNAYEIESTPAVIDEEGNVISLAIMEEVPAEYEIVLEDTTDEIQNLKLEADKKSQAKEKLKTFDKSKITTVAGARDWIAELVEILK